MYIRQAYKNGDIDMNVLIELIKSLREDPNMKVHETQSSNPMGIVKGLFKW